MERLERSKRLLSGALRMTAAALLAAGCSADAVPGGEPDMAPGPTGSGGDMACATQSFCGGQCVDLLSDGSNCGGCGIACSGGAVCQAGKCITPECAADQDCDDTIRCTVDRCMTGFCQHAVGPNEGATACQPGMVCDAMKGCVPFTGMIEQNLCAREPPMGAATPPPPPKYAGMCPQLIAYAGTDMSKNTIMSSGAARTFLLAVPAKLDPSEHLPVIFLWHWLGGSAKSFYDKGEVQAAVDQQRFLAILPENKKDARGNSDLQFKWPFTTLDSEGRMKEEFQFFDDMYACAAEQFKVNVHCVSSAGVSAGALFTDQLVGARSNVLAAAMSLSGGTGGLAVKPWAHPPRHVPMLVLWGGPMDTCVVLNFQDLSRDLQKGLIADGSFFMECIHNCKHGEPPFEPPMGVSKYSALWQFAFDHPYWLPAGDSPYRKAAVPATYPPWCGIGKDSAVPRTGDCPPPGC